MENKGHRNITALLGLLVLGLFALCVAAVLLTGGKTYQTLTRRAELSHSRRTGVRYLTTRFHQAPEVSVEDFCGLQALTIREEIGGKTYITRVYCHEGAIRELYSGVNAPVQPEDGERILDAEALAFSQEDGLLTVCIIHPDGTAQQILLALPEWKEGQDEE